MGVWIETCGLDDDQDNFGSHPVWVCGLKPLPHRLLKFNFKSHPIWVCGLKQSCELTDGRRFSHTLYGCVDSIKDL